MLPLRLFETAPLDDDDVAPVPLRKPSYVEENEELSAVVEVSVLRFRMTIFAKYILSGVGVSSGKRWAWSK